MFPNLRAEMARRNLTIEKMAESCGVSTQTMSLVLSGKRRLTYSMALSIKNALDVDIPLEILFDEKAVV